MAEYRPGRLPCKYLPYLYRLLNKVPVTKRKEPALAPCIYDLISYRFML